MESRSRVFGPLLMLLVFGHCLAWNDEYYTAAVFEHNRQGDNFTDDAAAVIKSNLEYYKRAAKVAKSKGADIILFPEYGLFQPLNRSELKKFLEFVPDPKGKNVTPCDEKSFADRPVMYSLSCLAKTNHIVVVANMGGIEKCENQSKCPDDGDLHFNTNVAFDETGRLIARYYKERLFFEDGMDLPRVAQNPIFETKFGRFATFICFDIIYEKMAVTSRLKEVDAVLFSTMWMNSSPFYTSTQYFQAWAVGNNATILASNIQKPGYLATGSGIFKGKKNSVAHTLDPNGIPKLIVAKVPKRDEGISSVSMTAFFKNGIEDWTDDDRDIPEVCSYDILGPAKDVEKDYRCLYEKVQNYTLTKLQNAKDNLKVCHNGMCCELNYAANGMNESYYLGVYNGTVTTYSFERYFWAEENCFLARCDDVNGTECSVFPPVSGGTLFYRISMTANFTSKYIYPSFVSNRMKTVPVEEWDFKNKPGWSSITLTSKSGLPVIAATLKGRAYQRDPPYIR